MLEYDTINVFEGFDVNKTNPWKKIWYLSLLVFLRQKFQITAVSLQWLSWFNAKSYKLNYVVIVSAKKNNYRIHFWYMSKDDAINIMKTFI